ncbi:MAG: class I SAM-dependent methyltransferase [Bdellovibrio sp.]
MDTVNVRDQSNLERWENFRKTSVDSEVRQLELKRILHLINANPEDTVLEIGTGGCYLTFPLSRQIYNGHLITADVDEFGLNEFLIKKKYLEEALNKKLPIDSYLFSHSPFCPKKFPKSYTEKFDIITSLATFHHFDSRATDIQSGRQGRIQALKEFYSMLKLGGRLIIADVANGSASQRYFDAIDNPRHFSPHGHPHDFFTLQEFRLHLEEIGFSVKHLAIEEVPWKFQSEGHCMHFLSRLHNAKCPPDEVLELAKDILGLERHLESYTLNWQLMFMEAVR